MIVYKNLGETTSEFSERIKNKNNAKKVAICGKLDPMARGYTTVLLDNETKMMNTYLGKDKTYSFYIAVGIKTTSDDILGSIVHSDLKNNYSLDIISYLNNVIRKQTTQKFHPYSAIKINIDGKRKSLHQLTREGKIDYDILPEKKINISKLEIEKIDNWILREYREVVLRCIGRLSTKSKTIFEYYKIDESWKNLKTQGEIKLIDVTMTVSSGYYIRMIPYYIYRDLGIPTHIFDINRINT